MALILHIETTTPTCSVALSASGKLLSLEERTAPNIHAGVITRFIDGVMQEARKSLEELDAVSVSMGPGSYTGLRIGVSTAKGLCYALDKPLISVGTLEAMAAGLRAAGDLPADARLCPMLDARRMEVFMAVYDAAGKQLQAPLAQVMDEQALLPWLSGSPLYYFGTGAAKCIPLLEKHPDARYVADFRHSAANLVSLAEAKFGARSFENVAYFEPYYLKDFIGTQPRKVSPGSL